MKAVHSNYYSIIKILVVLPIFIFSYNSYALAVRSHEGENRSNNNAPNIVFILLDDVGWKDLGCYGSKYYDTPNIDNLANQGIRFTQSYAYPQCSPTRYGLLTGQNPARAGLTHAIIPSDHDAGGPYEKIFHHRHDWYLADPAILDRMPQEIQTLPELLRNKGYSTAMFGKWHLGTMKDDPPTKHGFDVYYGGAESGPNSYFSPYKLEFLNDGPPGEHLDDRLTSEAIGFLGQQINKKDQQPFFLYMSYYNVHEPWQAKPELIEKYSKKIDFGDRQINPVYAAMIATVDENIGKLVKFLKDKGILENTIVIVSGDNGGMTLLNGFGRDNRGVFPIGTTITSNEPLRGGKNMIYEGGIRVPTIVLWPGGRRAVVDDTPIAVWDWMPTLLCATKTNKPKEQDIDGVDLLPLILNMDKPSRNSLFWHFPHYQIGPCTNPDKTNFTNHPCTAIRRDNWKLIYYYDAAPELFNLADDFRENNNLAKKQPQLVRELSNEILEWIKQVDAYLPFRNVNYRPEFDH